jgi:serine/threonine protein kinase
MLGPNSGYNARHVDVRSQWKDEIEMIKMVDRHPNIVRVLDAWEGAKFFNTVMDLALGGDLQTLIDISGPLPEPSAAFLMAVLINTLDYVHTVGILHRDVRPPNILFLTKHHLPSEILLIDFGLSAMLPSDGRPLTEFNLGAPFYTAPELSAPISPGYGPAADFFSAGSCAQFILTGARPGTPFPPKMSEDAVDFITRLRDPDQFSRPTGQKALEHPWIVKNVDVETLIYLKGLNGEVLEGKMLGQRTATFSKREETVVVGTAGQAVPSPAKPEKKGLKKFIAGLFGSK